MKRPLENLEVRNYPHRQTENLYDTKTSRELGSLIIARIWENVLKSCAMKAKKRKERKEWRELNGKQCKKKILQQETPPD